MTQNFQSRLREIRNRQEEPQNKVDKKYTLDELELSLFDKDSDVIKPFSEIGSSDVVSGKDLFIASLSQDVTLDDGTKLEKGQYIGNSKGKLSDIEDMEESGIPSKTLYENGHRINMIALIDNPKAVYTQKDLVMDIKNDIEVKDITLKSASVVSRQRIDYLELVDSKFFDNKIDDVLKNYYNLSEPDKLIKKYISNKNKIKDGNKMIYCSLLDKGVLVVGGNN